MPWYVAELLRVLNSADTRFQYIGAYLSYNINQSGAFIIAAGAIRKSPSSTLYLTSKLTPAPPQLEFVPACSGLRGAPPRRCPPPPRRC